MSRPVNRFGIAGPSRRPAETATGVAAAVAFLAGRIFGWDGGMQGAVTVIVGAVPAGVTWLVELLRRRES